MVATRLRRGAFLAARARSSHVTVTVDGISYVVSTRDDGPGGALVVHRTVPELDQLPRALSFLGEREGGVFVDVGANIGTTTLPAVIRHGFGRALAIEPEPENVLALTASVGLNVVPDRVEIVAAAASDVPGEALFHRGRETERGWRAGAGSLLGKAEGNGLTVQVTTVDAELAAHGIAASEVGLLWIDVQGFEGHVLGGAARLVDAGVPIVFALRPKKLAKAGRLDALTELVRARYPHIVDLRARDGVLPASSLSDLVARTRTTDVLAFGAA